MHIAVLFLLVVAYFFYLRKNDAACGACIALAAALKIYPILFFGYFLIKRRWRAALVTAAALIFVILISRAVMGPEILHNYAFQQLPRSLQGELMDPYNAAFASGASLLHRVFLFEPELNPSPLINSPVLYTVLYPLWQMTMAVPLLLLLRPSLPRADREIEQVEWAAILVAMLTLSPIPVTYHFIVLILPVTLLLDSLLQRSVTTLAVLAISLYVSISLIGAVKTPLPSLRFWLVSALYLLTLAWLWSRRSQDAVRPSSRDLALAASLGACGLIAGIAAYHHHFAHRDLQMSARLPLESSSYLATDPAATARGILFVAMTRDGYRVLSQRSEAAARPTTMALADQLSFTAAPGDSLIVEIADATGSRIIRASDGTTLADDAESPALSPDGKTLAYIREAKGHSTLRATDLSAANGDQRLTDESYDVRQARFFGSYPLLLFVAKHQGRQSLFTVSPGQQPVPFLSAAGDIAAFAVSLDGQRIAFTVLVEDRWQLAYLDVQSHHVTMLTANDCNAYQPTWRTSSQILYATDCGRGLGLTALASAELSR
jgi:hypothetical protein